jgi:regulator of protease activity HflC (stomatin/prohibitin superfamily)
MAAHIQEAARKIATALTLDEIFESKEEIRKAVTDELKDMETFGFDIHKVLVTNLTPDQRVMDAMNQINASNRLLEATKNQAEAEKIKMVKAAEAEKESKKLQGEGSAGQQMAIAEGRRQSIEIIKKAAPNADDTQILELTLMTQYIDMLREIGKKGDVIFVPYNPAAMSSGLDQIRDVVLATTKKQGTPSVSSR